MKIKLESKGFTLIEVMSVIVILTIIVTIAVPSISKVINYSKERSYNLLVQTIEDSAQLYVAKDQKMIQNEIKTKGIYEVELFKLIDEGLLKGNMIDPRTNEPIPTDNKVKVMFNEKQKLIYCYEDEDNVCPLPFTLPIITLNGSSPVVIYEGDTYNEEGATAKDVDGNSIEQISITSNVDTTKRGTYIVTYTAVDNNGREGKTTRTVKVKGEFDDESGAFAPKLASGMIPIKWDGLKWVKTDVNNWYNYDKKKWANVVLVTSEKRTLYQHANPGTEILEDDVLAYLVWIPRYRYKLWNVGTGTSEVQTITINFETSTMDPQQGEEKGNWLTHPAFTFGNEELTGFWIGKFETACANDNSDETKPLVKPGIASKRSLTVSELFEMNRQFDDNENQDYSGLDNNFDAHLLKNMEWGAVAYLSHSQYGKDGEIWINNSSDYTTGCAGNSASASLYSGCQNAWNTTNGQKASTTGNVYGVYDMNGGAWEYVMGGMYKSNNNQIETLSSGFDPAWIDDSDNAKYIDKYKYGTLSSDYIRRQLGDATGETRGWYSDHAVFVYSSYSWFLRGGYHHAGSDAGVFAFNNHTGRSVVYYGSRLGVS